MSNQIEIEQNTGLNNYFYLHEMLLNSFSGECTKIQIGVKDDMRHAFKGQTEYRYEFTIQNNCVVSVEQKIFQYVLGGHKGGEVKIRDFSHTQQVFQPNEFPIDVTDLMMKLDRTWTPGSFANSINL